MNNSLLPIDDEKKPDLRERAGRLTTLIESVEFILQTKEWSTLKEEEFDGRLERMERNLLSQAKKKELNTPEIYRLQGAIFVLKSYQLDNLRNKYRAELDGINKLL